MNVQPQTLSNPLSRAAVSVADGASRPFFATISSNNMAPWRKGGEAVLVDPNRSVRPGDFVFVELEPEDDGEPGRRLVLRLTKAAPDHVELEQLNPRRRFTVPRMQIRAIHWAAGMDEPCGS